MVSPASTTPLDPTAIHTSIQTALLHSTTHGLALPLPSAAAHAASTVPAHLPAQGLGDQHTLTHLLQDLTPGFNGPKTSAHYYGFVTGGTLPIAEAADGVVTAWDQNVQVHLPAQSVSTVVERRALGMLAELVGLCCDEGKGGEGREKRWHAGTFTTGATGSNILGLACGRSFVLEQKLRTTTESKSESSAPAQHASVGELGILAAARLAGITDFQVLSTMPHSSVSKAASIVGLGRASMLDVGLKGEEPWRFDFKVLEERLGREGVGTIVIVSCGEVNTGRFATRGREEMERLRELCDRFGAWLHVDGAFGLFARSLPDGAEFRRLKECCDGIELADSIAGDAHKCLNVPYDCGFFLTHSTPLLTSIFQNPNAAYLSSSTADNIPSPLNIGLENSRRFRALPVYAVLLSLGRDGFAALFARQVRLARLVAGFVSGHAGFELLPAPAGVGPAGVPKGVEGEAREGTKMEDIGIIVLFRAVDDSINKDLAARINRTGRIMVSGTAWGGRPAVRIAVSTWKVEEERDLAVIKEVLEGALL